MFHGKITATLFPITLRQPLSALADLGVVMFMFAVGYLLDFGGAFIGASLAGVRYQRAGVLATLMNTRGLTGIVVLSVGLQLHILDQSL